MYIMQRPMKSLFPVLCSLPSEVAAGHSVVVEVSPDIHICGSCKKQYNNYKVFLAHKQNECFLSTPDTLTTTATSTLTGNILLFLLLLSII